MLESWLRDFQQSLRGLVRAPAFTLLAILTLGIGIGGTATMFTAVNAAFLQRLPYPGEDRLTVLWQTKEENRQIRVSMLDFNDWETQSRSFSDLAAFRNGTVNVTSGTNPSRSPAADVVPRFFAVMGVPPLVGRTFAPEEAVNDAKVVVLSHALWKQVFNGDRGVVRRTINLDGADFQVIGVMPEGFSYPDGAAVWFPLPTRDTNARSAHNYRAIGRMKPGVSLEQARSDMDAIAARLAAAYPDSNAGYGITVVPLRQDQLGKAGPVLLLLLGAVFLVLLISCANVVNLLFARTLDRLGEATVRLVLGADRFGLLRPFVTESLLLSLGGGLAGLGLALLGRNVLTRFAPEQMLDATKLHLDGTVLLFTLCLTLVAGFACGLAPALRVSRQDLRAALAEKGRTLSGARRGINALVAAEVALAFLLLVGAGLLLRSAGRLADVDLGFRPEKVSLTRFSLGGAAGSHYEDEGWRVRFLDGLLERAGGLAGIQAVGVINQAPLVDGSYNGTLELADAAGQASPQTLQGHYRLIGGRYFEAMGIPLLRGQSFTVADRAGAPLVAMVNDRLAKDLAGSGDVLGRRLRIPGMDGVQDWATVVGVAGDVRHRGLDREPVPEIYFPYAQRPGRAWGMSLVVRSGAAPESVLPGLRREIRVLDPVLPFESTTLSDVVRDNLAPARFRAFLLAAFALAALLMACVGIFGVVSYAVSQRRREIGIRMALGADRGSVRSLVLRSGMTPVLIGIAAGALGALVLTRLLSSMLFEVQVRDPGTFLLVAAVLAATALLAILLPARRAMGADPIEALRTE